MRRVSVLALAVALAACRGGAGRATDGGPAVEPPWPGLTLDLTPDPAREEVLVEVRVSGERAAAVRELTVARRWADTRGADTVTDPRARDADGELRLVLRAEDGGPDEVYALARPPAGSDLSIRYRARTGGARRSRFALRVGADRMSGVGHAFLLLPRFEDRIPVRLRTHVDALRRGADAASSFGFGKEIVTSATTEELAHAVYVAGLLWREGAAEPAARGESPPPDGTTTVTEGTAREASAAGGAELFVLGAPPFDTRTAFDHALAAGAAVDRFFGAAPAPEPFVFVLVAQRGLGRGHDGAYLTRSLGVWFDTSQPLDAALDLVVAHELTHRYLGGSVRLVGRDGREAMWFSEGFTVHFARRALLAAGRIGPADYVADIRRSLGTGDERLPPEYRRGALHAAWLDAALRRSSQGRRSLDHVVRELVAAAKGSANGSLPVSALRDAIARELGAAGAEHVDRLEEGDDSEVDLPDDAFGPCARRTVRESTVFDLGLDRRSLTRSPSIVRGVSAGSPADRAGLRDGTLVLKARIPAEAAALGSARAEVELALANGKRVHYRPVATKRDVGWEAADCPARGAEGAATR